MALRSSSIGFIIGVFLLGFGFILALSLEPWEASGSGLGRWEESEDPVAAWMVPGIMIILGLVFTVPLVVQWASESNFIETALEPPEEGALLGGEAVVRVRLVPRRAARVASAELRLISEEENRHYEGSPYSDSRDLKIRVMELHRWTTSLEIPQDLDSPLELEVPIPIPRELPPSFRWERHMARTRLELQVVLIGQMDLHLESELLVLPRYASGAGA
jgi:hypothetical protein